MAKAVTASPDYSPPTHLSERSQNLSRAVVPRRAKSPERLAVLVVALEALDRADEAAAAVKVAGMTTTTPRSGAVHLHPLLKVERESRQLFAKIWHSMSLQWSPDIDGRVDRSETVNAMVTKPYTR